MKRKQLISGIMFFSIFAFVVHYALNDMETVDRNIKKYPVQSIAKVIKFYQNRSFNTYYFTYYYKGIEYNMSEHINGFDGEEHIGKYYSIKFSSRNPNYCKLMLEKEITDHAAIENAGFK